MTTSLIEYAANQGGAEFAYVGEVEDDSLAFDIKRRVERDTKEEEIRKSKQALERRREKGCWEGRPRWGTKYDESREFLVPAENFEEALRAIKLREQAEVTYEGILEETSLTSTGTLTSILERADWYRDLAEEHNVSEITVNET